VIGGVIGKVVTDENAGAAAGAIIGGAVANQTGKKTVTKCKEVETCSNVYNPERITDEDALREVLQDLDDGKPVSKETIMDAQYTIGVAHDGKWGPKSRLAAENYLVKIETDATMHSLMVNGVVIVSSADAGSIDQIKNAQHEAGVESQIFVDLQ